MSVAVSGAKRAKASHIWERDPNDWYVEPEWCSRRLFEVETFDGEILDPACGIGRIVSSARAAGLPTIGADLVDRGAEVDLIADFMQRRAEACNIVSNQPFRIADAFASLALDLAVHKVALLLPVTWMCGARRAAWLATTPLFRVWVLSPRPSMPPGASILAGVKPGSGTTDFAWFVWLKGFDGVPALLWLRRDAG